MKLENLEAEHSHHTPFAPVEPSAIPAPSNPQKLVFSAAVPLLRQSPEETNSFYPDRRWWTTWLMLVLLCGGMFFYGLNVGGFQKTEGLRAIIGAEMLRTGNYLVPILYDKPLLTKPPLMYAAIAVCSLPFGEVTEFSARLPSAIAASLTVLLMYWYAARHLGRLGGLIVAAVTPCGALWIEKASSAEIDMMQVFWTSAALLFFFRAAEPAWDTFPGADDSRCLPTAECSTGLGWWLLALLCVAGGVLTKWTTPVFFYGAAIPFLIWQRRLPLLWSKAHILAASIGAAICAVWGVAVVAQVGGETLWTTVLREAKPRLSHAHHLQSGPEIARETLLHPFKLWASTLPWSGFALLALLPAFHRCWDERGRWLLAAFHCWAWPNLLVMTILPEHAIRHSFPLLPGITALGAMAWFAYVRGKLTRSLDSWHTVGALAYAGGLMLVVIAGAVLALAYLPAAAWWMVVIVAGMGLWCAAEAVRSWRGGRRGAMLASLVIAWVVMKVAIVQVYLPWRDEHRQPRAKAALVAQVVPDGKPLYLIRVKDEGLMFYYRRQVVRLDDWSQLPLEPAGGEPVYCIVTRDEREWMLRQPQFEIRNEWLFRDTQDDSITVLEITRPPERFFHARTRPVW